MYTKNKSFLKDIPETGEVKVTSAMLQLFRRQLKDQNYSISKIYGFKAKSGLTKIVLKEEHFALPVLNFM